MIKNINLQLFSSNAHAPMGTPANEYLGPGAIYFNYGDAGEAVIGATKGGGEFSDNAEFRHREADGDLGPVKGAIDLIKMTPVLKVNALKIDKTNLQKYFAGMSLDDTDGTYSKLTRTMDLDDSYITNVAFVGQNRSGLDIVIILYDAIGLSPLMTAFTKDLRLLTGMMRTHTLIRYGCRKHLTPQLRQLAAYHLRILQPTLRLRLMLYGRSMRQSRKLLLQVPTSL